MKIKSILFVFTASLFLLNSCKKDSTAPSTPTPEQMLTKGLWKMDEITFAQVNTSGGGIAYYYKHGVTGNIANLDNESILFNINNTGTFTLGSTIAPITWGFTDAAKTKIQWIITYSPGNTLTVNWNNVTITDTKLQYGENYTTSGGVTSVGVATQIH